MATIISEIFQDGADQCLALNNEEFGRALTIGSNWNDIFIGILCSIEPNGINNLTDVSLRIGMSPSASWHAGDAIPLFWYGAKIGGNTTQLAGETFTYFHVGGNSIFYSGGTVRFCYISGSIYSGTNAGTSTMVCDSGSIKRKWPIVVRLYKTGGNIQVSMYLFNAYTSAGLAALYYSTQDFLTMMETATGAGGVTISGSTLTNFGNTTLGYDTWKAPYGEIDTVQVGWNKPSQALKIWALAVSRKS